MQRKTLIRHFLILTLLLIATATLSQAQTQTNDSAADTRQTQAAQNGDECAECNRRLEKVLTDLEAAESVIAAQRAELEARSRLEAINNELLRKKDEIIAGQEKYITLLEKRPPKKCFISIFNC